jgi:hypothetical protein
MQRGVAGSAVRAGARLGEATTSAARQSASREAICAGGSSVLIGTGTTPARRAPQNAIGKAQVSRSTSAIRSSRRIPARASAAANPLLCRCRSR